MEANQDRHDLAQTETAESIASLQPSAKELASPKRLKGLAEIIDATEQFF
jgi:gamma-glutamyl:cysteine ligase YbdK (ATP-grasp superfamily)